MRVIAPMIAIAAIAGLLAVPIGAQPASVVPPGPAARIAGSGTPAKAASFKIQDSFTAQRRPRVTVLTFENTNQTAQKAKYGAAVEAMLVTFLKRKSQFVVVERQKINTLLSEKERLQTGMVQVDADDPASLALLEKIDVFVLGSVTLLDIPTRQSTAGGPSENDGDDAEDSADRSDAEEEEDREDVDFDSAISAVQIDAAAETDESAGQQQVIEGPRIEIDAKLISRFDGRIIAAAQRSGPVACLRSIIERLGIALEQEFLRPYYGTLTVTLNEPEHIRLFLTPILPADALDEEKPPVERSTTVTIGSDKDTVEPWTTDPTTYTINSLLSGWYSMRIERPGYTGIRLENARWEVRKRSGKEVVFDRVTNRPLDKVDPSLRRFVVQVTPLTTDVLDIKDLEFTFTKEGGSFTSLVKRQFIDDNFSRGPQRVLLLGGPRIDLNRIDGPGEFADDPRCDLFKEETPVLTNYGRTSVAAGQTFRFDQFTGGELIIEDYKGEVVPVGRYTMVLWEPAYQLEKAAVMVRNNDKSSFKVSLTRETAKLHLSATGARPSSHAFLAGEETRHRIRLPLDFSKLKEIPGVPVDKYTASTDISDLKAWSHGVQIPATNLNPPFYDAESKRDEPRLLQISPRQDAKEVPFVGIKTRFGLGGRLRVLSKKPDPLAADLFINPDIAKILNLLLHGVETRPEDEEDRPTLEEAVAQAGRDLLAQTVIEVDNSGGLSKPKVSVTSRSQPPGKSGGKAPDAPQRPRKDRRSPAQEEPASQQVGKADEDEEDSPAADPDKATRQEDKPAVPKPSPFPKDPDALRKLLAERLEVIDLLVLDPVDMVQLRQSPEVAGIIARWVAAGGSLFAFVSSPGDYRDAVGAPLAVEALSKRTKRFDLAPGAVPGIVQITKKKVKSKGRRRLPELTDLDRAWRVLAYTKAGKGARIIERGTRGQGGYVVLWFDDPETFRGRWGGTRPEVEQTRANVEEHVFRWSRDLMRARFGEGAAASRTASSGQ